MSISVPKNIFNRKGKTKKSINLELFSGVDSIPDKIQLYIKNDEKIDRNTINKTIIHKYKKLNEKIDKIKEELEEYRLLYKTENIVSNKEWYKNIIIKIEKKIYDYENFISLSKFKNDIKENPPEDTYIDIISNYINIEIIRESKKGVFCINCGEDLKNSFCEEENIYQCEKCECYNNLLAPVNYNKDGEYGKLIDDDIQNFLKILDKFEGKNELTFEKDFFQKLDNYFIQNGKKNGLFYKDLPLNDKGKKDGTNKKILFKALEILEYSQYYDETNYIAYVYWGWKLPSLEGYKEQIIDDYQKTEKIWNIIKHKYRRSASLGTQYRLYVHLKAVDFDCEVEDFKIQNMVDSLNFHNDVWKIMTKKCDVKYVKVSIN